ncbi:hypothetical protein [Brasilonema sp. UFV-L1]|uniref:hypothetical protein n=1 Tax=Brasilonema sp. UFV-L1 TaxID=2234130 RepID=UPI002006DBBC|nr:hypothetical protein [Brasilonema sp. UFV-L1]
MSVIFLLANCSDGNKINKKNTAAELENQQSVSLKSTPQASPQPSATFDQAKSEQLTNTAKFLAGISVDSNSSLSQLQNNKSWLLHHRFFENAWSKLETSQLTKVRQWSQQELKQIHSQSVFYPFSGPDFLYAYSFFPKGKEYVLVGLEPVGSIPDLASLSENKRDLKLQEVRGSLYAILQFSFFLTNEMKVDLQKQGVLPILYVFLARTENRILDVQQIGLDRNAKIQPFQKGMVSGVKMTFLPKGESQPRNLYYFSTDLSDGGLKKRPEFYKFISQLDKKLTYLKAASYLMYYENFSEIKKLILTQSHCVLQDDSGMPFKAFENSKWDLKFYGNYTTPIGLFANRYQSDLRKIYLKNKSIKPLNFGVGYKFGVNDSNLMLAEVKTFKKLHKSTDVDR